MRVYLLMVVGMLTSLYYESLFTHGCIMRVYLLMVVGMLTSLYYESLFTNGCSHVDFFVL